MLNRIMDERQFSDESRTTKPATLSCPRCGHQDTYELRWLVRKKKKHPPHTRDERVKARFKKFQSYMVLLDDTVNCSRCRRRIEVSGMKTTAYLDDAK